MPPSGDSRGALVLHGFTGNPQSMRGAGLALADAGLTVELPLLPGHGTDVADMAPDPLGGLGGRGRGGATPAGGALRRGRGRRACPWAASSPSGWRERHPEIAALVLVNPLVAAARRRRSWP